MSIQDLGSLGELLAAIATIATLIYLALQIRQNTTVIDQSARRGIMEDASRWRQNLIQHADVADLYRRGSLDPEALDPVERLRFRMLLYDVFDHWFFQWDSGTMIAELNRSHIAATLKTPGGAAFWKRERARFQTSFREYVDGIDESGSGDA